MIVLDASAAIELLLNTAAGTRVRMRIQRPSMTLHAPHLIDLEVAQVLRRCVRTGDLEENRAKQVLADLVALDLTRYPHDLFLSRIWQLKDNLTAYDAAYVALAEILDAPLLTLDERLSRSSGHRARIDLAT